MVQKSLVKSEQSDCSATGLNNARVPWKQKLKILKLLKT